MAELRQSQIETLWSVVRQAHADDSEKMSVARARLIDRYRDAIRRYLMDCLRSQGAVDKDCQELALRFARGSFFSVSAKKGRFCSYIRTVIYHLVADFGRRKKKYAATAIAHESMLAGTAHQSLQLDEQFQTSWRDSLLGKEVSSGNVGVLVHRVRECFAEILIDLVRESLARTDQATLEHELIDLNLRSYCKPLLQSDNKEGGP